jgi:hypothetical protein
MLATQPCGRGVGVAEPIGLTAVTVELDPSSLAGRRRVEPASPQHEPPCVGSAAPTGRRHSARSWVNLDGHRCTELLCRHLKVLQGVTTREVWSCEELPEEPPVRSGLAVVSTGPAPPLLDGHAAF